MKPIIFSTPMVRAILDGRKTQTRRAIKPQPLFKTSTRFIFADETCPKKWEDCEYFEGTSPYHPGDILWVREAFVLTSLGRPIYKAGYCDKDGNFWPSVANEPYDVNWKPSIYMPRSAARIFLEVKAVRVERVQEISESDAKAEGVSIKLPAGLSYESHVGAFSVLWDTLNAKRGYGWDTNPWVWVYEFERME